MSTTQLFVEHLIAGALSLFGLCLIVISIIGLDSDWAEQILGYEGLLTTLALSIMYPLGIFTDNFLDYLLKGRNTKIRERFNLIEKRITVTRLLLRSDNENISKYFNFSRMRIRISRSAIFNFFIVTLGLT